MSAYSIFEGFARSTFLHIDLERRGTERSNLSFKSFSCERARIAAKAEFFINTSMYNVCIVICPREIGGSESLFERLEIANWETMHELEREFRVTRKQLGAFEEDLKLHGRVRCEDL
jgi:hypothetical protein